MNKPPFLQKYQRERSEIPSELRTKKLLKIIKERKANLLQISHITNRKIQTVRCWTSSKNPRIIPMDALLLVYKFFGSDVYLD